MNDTQFAARLRAAREEAGLTQAELGARIGVSGSMIAQYESTSSYARNPKPVTIERFAEALSIPVSRLLGLHMVRVSVWYVTLAIFTLAIPTSLPSREKLYQRTAARFAEAKSTVFAIISAGTVA